MERMETASALNKQQVTINLRPADLQQLDQVAQSEQISRSAVARRAVASWLQEHGPEPEPTR